MISVVNGYVCASSCDAAAAKQGKDPSAPPGSAPGTTSKTANASGYGQQPATVLDGALKSVVPANAVSPDASSQPSVNRLV